MPHDRLAQLAGCHGHLRYRSIASLDAYRAATPEQLARMLPKYRAMIRRLVDKGDPDVMLALWPPGDLTWGVAGLTYDPMARLLSVGKGPHAGATTSLLSLTYDVNDADAERRAWVALKAVLNEVSQAC